MKSICISIVLFCLLSRAETYSQWIQTEGPLDSLNIFFLMPTDSSLYVGTNFGLHTLDSFPGKFDMLLKSKLSSYAMNGNKAFFGGYETGIIFLDLSKSQPIPDTFMHYTTVNTMICNDSCLYAGNTMGFYKSTYRRGSNDWGSFNHGLPADSVVYSSGWVQKIYHINAIEQIQDTIFCATHKGIFRTRADNLDWKLVNYGLPEGSYQLLKVINDTIFAGCNQTLFYSVNSGNTWDSCFSSPSLITSVYRFKEVTYITTKGNGIYTSRNGSGWTTLNSGLCSLKITTLQLYKNTVVCGTISDGLYFLNNNTWHRNNRGMIYTAVKGITSTGKFLFSNMGNKIHISGDGTSWKEITPRQYAWKENYESVCALNDIVFISLHKGSGLNFIYYTMDNGIGWDSIPYIPTKRDLTFSIAGFIDRFYFCSLYGWYYTNDMGMTWNETKASDYPSECFPGSESPFCDKDFQAYIRMVDQSWIKNAKGLPEEWLLNFNYIANTSDALYTNLYLSVFVKSDTCPSWTKVGNAPSFNRGIRSYAYKDKNLFISTEYGVYFTDDYAQTWHKLNTGLPTLNVIPLVIKNDTLYAGTNGYGIWKYDLNKIHFSDSSKCPCAVENAEDNKFNFHPNPASDFLYIQKDNSKNNQIRIVDIQGKQLFLKSLNAINEISLSDFPSGIYLITLWNDIEYFFDKLVIVH